jgi:hypothetical protein
MSAMDEDSTEDDDGLNPWGDPIEIDVSTRLAHYSMAAHVRQIIAFAMLLPDPCQNSP